MSAPQARRDLLAWPGQRPPRGADLRRSRAAGLTGLLGLRCWAPTVAKCSRPSRVGQSELASGSSRRRSERLRLPDLSRSDGSGCRACRPPSASPTAMGEPAELTTAGRRRRPSRHVITVVAYHRARQTLTGHRPCWSREIGSGRPGGREACRRRSPRRGLEWMTVGAARSHLLRPTAGRAFRSPRHLRAARCLADQYGTSRRRFRFGRRGCRGRRDPGRCHRCWCFGC